jgi:hypothetical protein
MTMSALLLAGLIVAAAGAVMAGVAVAVSRSRDRRNRVVPEVATSAPSAWAGAHTPLARLHRRLRAAVQAVRAIPDPDGALIRARVEIEQAALEVDGHLVALHGLLERDRATRMAPATAAVASVEEAAARLADAAVAGRPGDRAMVAVEEALERAALVAEARQELDEDPAAILEDGAVDGRMPPPLLEERATDQGDEPPRPRPSTG